MANYRINPNQGDQIRSSAEALCNRRIALAEGGFPMSVEQIEHSIVPLRCRELFAKLRVLGAENIGQTFDVNVRTPPSVSGVTRRATLKIILPTRIDYVRNDLLDMDISELTEGEVTDLAEWVNNNVREQRIKNW